MEKIRRELGSDAVILSQRTVRKKGLSGLFQKKLVEVMVAYEPAQEKGLRIDPPAPAETASYTRQEEARQPFVPRPQQASAQSAQPIAGVSQYQQAAAQYWQNASPPDTTQLIRKSAEEEQPREPKIEAPVFTHLLSSAAESRKADAVEAALHAVEALEFSTPSTADNEQPSAEKIDQLNEKLAELKGVVRNLTNRIITAERDSLLQFAPSVMRVYNALLEQDMQEMLARSIAERVQLLSDKTGDTAESIANNMIQEILGDPSPLKIKKYQQTVVMLVGPTGVGKTTTLVKLAGMYAVGQGLKVGFINTDTYRVAAQEQLKIYAEIMDIPCCTVYTPDEIPMALYNLSDCDLVLIDTAGKSMSDRLYHEELSAFIEESGADEILLHVSASMSYQACADMIKNFAFLPQYKLVITKLDEVAGCGNVLNISACAKKPIAFFTVGQNVPQDIEVPDMQIIANRLLEGAGA